MDLACNEPLFQHYWAFLVIGSRMDPRNLLLDAHESGTSALSREQTLKVGHRPKKAFYPNGVVLATKLVVRDRCYCH